MDGGFYLEKVGQEARDLSEFIDSDQSSDIEELNKKVTALIQSLEDLHSAHIGINSELTDQLYDLSDNISHSITPQTDERVKGIALGLIHGIELVSRPEAEDARALIKKMPNSPLKIQAFIEYPTSLEEDMSSLVSYIENQDLERCREFLELIKGYMSTFPNKSILEEKVTSILARKEFSLWKPDFQKVLCLVKEIRNWKDKKPFLIALVRKGVTSGLLSIIKNLSEEEIIDFYDAISSLSWVFQKKTDAERFLDDNKPAIALIKELDLSHCNLVEIIEEIKALRSFEGKKHVIIALVNKGFIQAAVDLIKHLPEEEIIDFYHFISQSQTEFASVELYACLCTVMADMVNSLEQKVLNNMSSERVSYVRELTYEGVPSHVENSHDFLEEALTLKGFRANDPSEDILQECTAKYVGTMIQDLARNYSYNICGYRISKDIVRKKMEAGGELDLSLEVNRASIKEGLIHLKQDYRLQFNKDLVQRAIDILESPEPILINNDLVMALCLIETWKQIDAMEDIDLEKICQLVSLLQQGIVGAMSQDFAKVGYEVDTVKFTLAEISVEPDFTVKSTLTTSLISSYLLHLKMEEPLLEPFFSEEERENKEFIAEQRKEVSKIGEFTLVFTCDLLGEKLSVDITSIKSNPIYNTWDRDSILRQGYIEEYASLYEENAAFLPEIVERSLEYSLSLEESKKAVKDLVSEIVVARDAAFVKIQKQMSLGVDDERVDFLLKDVISLYRSTNQGVNRSLHNLDDYIPCYLLNIASKTVAEKKEILQKAIADFPDYHKLLQKYKSQSLDYGVKIPPLKLDKIEEVSSSIKGRLNEL